MIEKWILDDVKHLIKHRHRLVIIDPYNHYEYLLPYLNEYKIVKVNKNLKQKWEMVKEELYIRYDVENNCKDSDVIFYVNRKQEDLSFLFDYCFTHGCLDFTNTTEWLTKKIYSTTKEQVHIDNSLLLTVSKLSLGKDINWWKKKLQKLEDIIEPEDVLLPFLHDPENFMKSKDKDVRDLMESKFLELLNQPNVHKPPKTLANEIVQLLFNGLLNNNISNLLLNIYHKWVDSETYSSSLNDYISNYKINTSIDPYKVNPEHCFLEVDKLCLNLISKNLSDKAYIKDKINFLKTRSQNLKIRKYVPNWVQDICNILEFQINSINSCNSLDRVIQFYTNQFSIVDRAMRKLYSNFLNEETLLRPFQEYYENLNNVLLDKWFKYSNEYKTSQQGYLVELFKNSNPKTSVIVGDGLRFEIANHVVSILKNKLKIETYIMLADMPSETEHNMSALYVGNNEVLPIHKNREELLVKLSNKNITFKKLEDLNYGEDSDYLVLSYKDIDTAGENLQQNALKLFDEFENELILKITQLLNMGYKEVHLVTDHGFVLAGLLTEADKIEPNITGKKKVYERYIRTVEKQNNKDLIGFNVEDEEYKYVYAAKSHRPFKSKGVYGYSHGGFTPQEIIIPNFVFRKENVTTLNLNVTILNKEELLDVTGEYFKIKLSAPSKSTDLFTNSRKVKVVLYANNQNLGTSNIITIEPNGTNSVEFSFNGNNEIKAVLLDVETLEQLDSATIKKSDVRDLGGLF